MANDETGEVLLERRLDHPNARVYDGAKATVGSFDTAAEFPSYAEKSAPMNDSMRQMMPSSADSANQHYY